MWNPFSWLINLFTPAADKTAEWIDSLEDDVRESLIEIAEGLEDTDKKFIIELNVGENVKMRPLKTALNAVVKKEIESNHPDVKFVNLKTYYNT